MSASNSCMQRDIRSATAAAAAAYHPHHAHHPHQMTSSTPATHPHAPHPHHYHHPGYGTQSYASSHYYSNMDYLPSAMHHHPAASQLATAASLNPMSGQVPNMGSHGLSGGQSLPRTPPTAIGNGLSTGTGGSSSTSSSAQDCIESAYDQKAWTKFHVL